MASLGKEPEEWVRDDIKKLVYLEAFINEVLRLYPPIPDMIFTAKKAFSTGNGKYNFKPGDMIIISQRITGRLTIAWGDDAEECKPERFYNEETKEKNVDEMLEFKFFPFGIKQRQCVGRNFSKQEVALIIGHIITKFDLQLKSKEGQDLHHPFPFHQVFTLRMGLEDINLHLKPREVPKVDSQQSMPLPQQFFNFKVGSHDFNLKLTLPNESVVLPAVQCEASRSLKHTS
jgi:cytochrome P450